MSHPRAACSSHKSPAPHTAGLSLRLRGNLLCDPALCDQDCPVIRSPISCKGAVLCMKPPNPARPGGAFFFACVEASIEPRFDQYAIHSLMPGAPMASRDLVDGQRYLIWKRANEKSVEWLRRHRAIIDAGNEKRSAAARGESSRLNQPTSSDRNVPMQRIFAAV